MDVRLTPVNAQNDPGALIQTGGRKCIICSTLAEVNCNGGFEDILYAVPITPDKFVECMALNNTMEKFAILVDSLEMIQFTSFHN